MKRFFIPMTLAFCGSAVSAETAPTSVCAIEGELCQKMIAQFVDFSNQENADFVVTMPFEIIPSVKQSTCNMAAPSEFAFSATWGPTLESNRRFYFVQSTEQPACFLSGYGSDKLRQSGKAGVAIGSLDSLRAE